VPSSPVPVTRVRVSAHATHGNPGTPGTVERYRQALASGADYVEFDIRRTADGQLVAAHDPRVGQGERVSAVSYGRLCELAGHEVPLAADILTAIKGRAKGHLDLKVTGGEDAVVRLALDILGPGEFIITTLEDASVAAIRSEFGDPDAVPVALSLGRDMTRAPRAAWLRTRVSELRPLSRLRACGATWVAAEHRLALAGVSRQCRRHQINVMVWTVNDEREMRYWLTGHRADVLITDRPELAVALRDRATGP
jgi:glycerophosphoryl diester phosphodiesterase